MSGEASSVAPAGALAYPRPGRTLIAAFLARIEAGALTVRLPDGWTVRRQGPAPGPEAVFELRRWRALGRLILGSDNGFAAGFIDGDWTSPDPVALLELAVRNYDRIPGVGGGPAPVRMFHRLAHGARANTRAGARRNIADHYDLGNEFYAHWLDAGMSYSSALFDAPGVSLEAAQAAKQAAVLDLLDAGPGRRVLEIGCGWGGLAERLAETGAEVTGVTLSPAQLAHSRDRLGGRARLLLQDYRDIEGSFDRIVSIEMIEAVGEAYWPTYFETLRRRLVPGGAAVLQAITIAEPWAAAYRRTPDFIQRHIFPGGMLPTAGEIARLAADHGFAITAQRAFGDSYALTLAAWRARFHAAWTRIAALGFPPRFRRLWDYYLAYCEAGFRTGRVDVGLWRLELRPA